MLKAKESKTLNVYASTKARLSGEKTFFATVKNNDKILRQMPFRANVLNVRSFMGIVYVWNIKYLLQVFLILAVISLVTLGVLYGLKEIARKDKKETAEENFADEIPDTFQGEAYY